MLPYHQVLAVPYVFVFVVTWLLLKLVDCLVAFGQPTPPLLLPVIRLVIVLVALILCLI